MPAPYDDVASALAEFLRRGAQNRDWGSWAELFTADADYVEHCLGRFTGREEISRWVTAAVSPLACMTFSLEWSMIDGDRAALWMWNHLPDPEGTGLGYDFPTLAVLTYAGDDRWQAAESFHSPRDSGNTVGDWLEAGGSALLAPDHSLVPAAPSHPMVPDPPPDRAVMEAVCDALVSENWLDLIETTGADWHDHGGLGIQHWADGSRTERYRVINGARAVIAMDHGVPGAVVAHVNAAGRVTYLDHVYNPAERSELTATH